LFVGYVAIVKAPHPADNTCT